MNCKKVYHCIFLFLLSYHCRSQVRETNQEDFALKKEIEILCNGKFPNFHKAHAFFFDKELDSTFLYASLDYQRLSKKSQIKDFLCYIYGVSAIQKGLHSLGKDKLEEISTSFPYRYLVDYNIAAMNLEEGKYAEALDRYSSVISSNKIKSTHKLKLMYHNIGICHLHLKNYTESENFLLKELEISQKEKDTLSIIYAKLDLGNLFYEQYKDDVAIAYFTEAYQLAQLFSNIKAKQITAQNMAVVEKNRENYKRSIDYYTESGRWKDSLWNLDKIWAFAEKDKQFVVSLKEKEIQIEKERSRYQQKQRNWFLAGTSIFLLLSGVLFSLYKTKVKQKEKLNKLNHLKDYLFSIVSHDLRSPINLVRDKNKKIRMALEKGNFEDALQKTKENERISESTIHLLNNVLHWTLQENDQLTYYPEVHTAHILVDSVLFDFKSLSKNRNIEVIADVNEAHTFYADKELFKIVLRNIVDNAIKYTPEGGEVTVRTHLVEGNRCNFVIEDTGLGMPTDVLGYINGKEDLSHEKINRSKGLGLGLILCKNLVALNKGFIKFENRQEVNKGLRVTITFVESQC